MLKLHFTLEGKRNTKTLKRTIEKLREKLSRDGGSKGKETISITKECVFF